MLVNKGLTGRSGGHYMLFKGVLVGSKVGSKLEAAGINKAPPPRRI